MPSLNIYITDDSIKVRLQAVAAKRHLFDQKGEPSISQAITYMLEKEEQAARLTPSLQMVDFLKAIEAVSTKFSAKEILKISAVTMNEWQPQVGLLDVGDIAAAIAARVMRAVAMQGSPQGLRLAMDYGAFFASLMDSRPDNFAPHGRKWTLFESAVLIAYEGERK